MSYRLSKKKEDIIFLTQKSEDLFICADEYLTRLPSYFLSNIGLFNNEINFNQIYQMQIDFGKDESRSVQKLRMILSIYFPELQEFLARVYMQRDNLNNIIREYKRLYKAGYTDGTSLAQEFRNGVLELSKINEAFLRDITEVARKVAAHRMPSPPLFAPRHKRH